MTRHWKVFEWREIIVWHRKITLRAQFYEAKVYNVTSVWSHLWKFTLTFQIIGLEFTKGCTHQHTLPLYTLLYMPTNYWMNFHKWLFTLVTFRLVALLSSDFLLNSAVIIKRPGNQPKHCIKRKLSVDLLCYRSNSAKMCDRKAVIKNADMSEEMQQDAVDCATQALEKFNIEKVSTEFTIFYFIIIKLTRQTSYCLTNNDYSVAGIQTTHP